MILLIQFLQKKNIKIFNTPGAFTKGVAQYAIGMLLNLSRKLTKSDASVKSGKWEKYQGIDIENKRVGIIGLGKIGSQIIRYLKPFNVQIYGNDKKKNINKSFSNKGINIISINKIFSKCDIIIICVDLNKSSFHLIGKQQMMSLNENKILINVSRGPVVDNKSLIKCIKKKNFQIGFDVFEEEPINKNLLNLLKRNNSILSSHNAFNTKEEVYFVHENTVKNLFKGLKV